MSFFFLVTPNTLVLIIKLKHYKVSDLGLLRTLVNPLKGAFLLVPCYYIDTKSVTSKVEDC